MKGLFIRFQLTHELFLPLLITFAAWTWRPLVFASHQIGDNMNDMNPNDLLLMSMIDYVLSKAAIVVDIGHGNLEYATAYAVSLLC